MFFTPLIILFILFTVHLLNSVLVILGDVFAIEQSSGLVVENQAILYQAAQYLFS